MATVEADRVGPEVALVAYHADLQGHRHTIAAIYGDGRAITRNVSRWANTRLSDSDATFVTRQLDAPALVDLDFRVASMLRPHVGEQTFGGSSCNDCYEAGQDTIEVRSLGMVFQCAPVCATSWFNEAWTTIV